MKKLFVGNLPSCTTEDSLLAHFSQFGKVHSIRLVKDLFSGQCKGFGFLEMEGHEARIAINGTKEQSFEGNFLKVKYEEEKARNRRR